ncbi:transposase [Microbulbifer salipaludis]|uniref:Transposase n=1 Tax=Microbulbifer salipaludis TaxID=187980 RepID=A0ABS3E6Z4_9GAMM|nr:transposase [Microbulbifer salipaludis]
MEFVCDSFEVSRSCYYEYKYRKNAVDVPGLELRTQVNEVFNRGRGSTGSRTIVGLLNDQGVVIGRFRVRSLMRYYPFETISCTEAKINEAKYAAAVTTTYPKLVSPSSGLRMWSDMA